MTEKDNARETQLAAYVDGELDEAARADVERALADDPALAEMLDDFRAIHTAVHADLASEADEISQARFEQVWDAVDAAITPSPATASESSWTDRLAAMFARWRAPLMAGAAAAVVGVWFMGQDDPANEMGVTVAAAPSPEDSPSDVIARAPGATAEEAPLPAFPVAESNEATIENLESSGALVQIDRLDAEDSRSTTVIWVEEEMEAADGGQQI